AAPGVPREDAMLLRGGESGVERHDLVARPGAGEDLGGVTDLPFAGEEDQDVAGSLAGQLLAGLDDGLGLVADDRLALLVLLGQLDEGAVADVDGIRATRDLD